MNKQYYVKIIDRGFKIDHDVYIYTLGSDNRTDFYYSDGIKTVGSGEEPQPSFQMSPQLLQEFANALAKMGINPTREFIEGKLEATEKHLQDMRNLVFNTRTA